MAAYRASDKRLELARTNRLLRRQPIMITDPEFSDIGKGKSKPRTGWSWVRWFLVYPLLGLAGCHMLMTGSPVPLWSTESLDHPVAVAEVTDKTLVLADGRGVALPFIKRLPRNDPVFLKALEHGVEVGQDGEVFGLIRDHRSCGNDPFVWRDRRINVSDLAGFMDPDCIDAAIVPVEVIKDLKENESSSLDHHGLPFLLLSKAHKMRSIYKASKSRLKEQPNPIHSFSWDQLDQ